MLLIEDILVADDVVEKHFVCDLNACKGACCVEGDYGAPLSEVEVGVINGHLESIMPYLPEDCREVIMEKGFFAINDDNGIFETGLMPDGACVFMGRNEIGITYCGIEKAYNDKAIDYKKPISCHLYPIRVVENKEAGFQALNYDKWDICSAACTNGKKKQVRVYEFAKSAILRKYGEGFYEALDAAANRDSK